MNHVHAIVTLPLSFHSELRCPIDFDQFQTSFSYIAPKNKTERDNCC